MPLTVLGRTGGERVVLKDAEGKTLVDLPVADLREAHETGLPRALGLLD